MTNIELLTTVNDFIRKYPALHNQAAYAEGVALPSVPESFLDPDPWMQQTEADLIAGDVCGTAFCFAGWAALHAGYHQCRDDETMVVDETGAVCSMDRAATVALDLTYQQAERLFWGANDQELIDRYVAHLVAHPDATSGDLREIEVDYIYSVKSS